jgi:hypothetical protein
VIAWQNRDVAIDDWSGEIKAAFVARDLEPRAIGFHVANPSVKQWGIIAKTHRVFGVQQCSGTDYVRQPITSFTFLGRRKDRVKTQSLRLLLFYP